MADSSGSRERSSAKHGFVRVVALAVAVLLAIFALFILPLACAVRQGRLRVRSVAGCRPPKRRRSGLGGACKRKPRSSRDRRSQAPPPASQRAHPRLWRTPLTFRNAASGGPAFPAAGGSRAKPLRTFQLWEQSLVK